MSESTVVLITGVSRGKFKCNPSNKVSEVPSKLTLHWGGRLGIGRSLVEAYLLRPGHVVVGSVRDTTSAAAHEVEALPTATGSRLVLVKIENTSTTDATEAVATILGAGIDHIDIVIANAGGGGPNAITALDTLSTNVLTELISVNAYGPLLLYRALLPLLKKAESPKWISVSSIAGTIGNMEVLKAYIAPGYAIAKTVLNSITVAVHSVNPWLVAFAIHPGLVQTELGNAGARSMGMPEAPIAIKQSTDAIMGVIDKATRDTTSGKFLDVITGNEIPW